jgi:hypothetical protein
VTVYINDSASANVSAGSMTLVGGPITRSGGANAWVNFNYIIPAGYNNSNAYIIFVFTNRETSGAGANMYFDSFSIQTWPKAQTLVSSTMSYQELSDVGKPASDQLIVGIKVIADGAGSPILVDSINFNANGTSSLGDIVAGSAKLWYTKGTNAFIMNGNQFGLGISPSFSTMKFTNAAFTLENGDNYFWLTYSTSAGAGSGNFIDADFIGINTSTPLISSILGGRQIDIPLCGGVIPTMIVGTSWLNGSYTNNDFINRAYLRGENAFQPSYPYIDNNINADNPFGQTYMQPFTEHPPDYEQLPQVSSHPTQPHTNAVLVQGKSYTAASIVAGVPTGQGLALQCGTWSSSNYVTAWIDFNKDGNLVPSEQIMTPTPLAALTWATAPVNVPPTGTSVLGNVKMRVREVWATNPIQPCPPNVYTYGEIEDYTVTIIPTCPALVKLWLGYTNDWNTAANWCGGVPTISDVALIDEVGYLGGTQTGAPFDPVIHAGTNAVAKTIRLAATDSLTIDAPTGSSLTIADSLAISYNTPAGGSGYMKVNSSFADTAQVSNGNLVFNITPFIATRKNVRMQLVYTKNELLTKGMIAGDYIDQMIFHIRQRANPTVASYAGFTIKYATVDSMWGKWTVPPTQLAPATSAYVTLYGPSTLSLPMAAGAAGDLTVNLATRMYWNGVSDLVVEICYNNSLVSLTGILNNDAVCQTNVTGSYQAMWLSNTTTNAGCALTWPLPVGTAAVSTTYRPNITFHFVRPYVKYPIQMTGNAGINAGNWVNNGTFVHGWSNVTFSNASQNQNIGGANVTTYCDLTVNKAGGLGSNAVVMGLNAAVDSFLVLTTGSLDLNLRTMTVNNPMATGIQRTSGWVQSEDLPTTYGYLKKKVSTTIGSHIFPFGTAAGAYIPLTFALTAGDMDYVTAATFATANDNTPYANNATMPGTVTHMNDFATGADLSIQNVADRFWQINKTGPSGTANVAFTITTAERPLTAGATDNTLRAQRWENPNINGNPGWLQLVNTATHVAATNTVTMNGLTLFDGPWTLSSTLNPLPIELLQFDATLVTDKVHIYWSTASELDNNYFTVERTVNGDDFDFIAKVYSQGSSTRVQEYEAWDLNPVKGLQYYRLKTTDMQGGNEYSKLVPVKLEDKGSFAINYITASPGAGTLEVWFNYDSNEPYTYSVVDIIGKTLVTKSNNAGSPGLHSFTIPVSMSKGIYFVVIENNHKKVASKVVY